MRKKRTYSLDAPHQQRLKIARAEIEGILKKHDLGGVVVLHTPGMTEFFYDITPSYSCVWIDEKAQMVRIRSMATDYGGDREAQARDRAATANMMHGFADSLANAAGMFGSIAPLIDELVGAEHTDGVHTPDPLEGRKQ